MKFLRRHVAISAAILILFATLGTEASRSIFHMLRLRGTPRPPLYVARMIDRLDPKDPVHGLALLVELDQSLMWDLAILNDKGQLITPGSPIPIPFGRIPKPLRPYEFTALTREKTRDGTPFESLIRLGGREPKFLYLSLDEAHRGPPTSLLAVTFGFQILAVLLGVSLSSYLLVRSLREKARLADTVLTELQNGNLKARFPITRMDELGQAMSRFNVMAAEIERLVDQLHEAERSRMGLLQELAHDLRTPVASMKNLLATMEKGGLSMDPKIHGELLGLSLKEVDYFAKLVEDLLTLAQISEPRYDVDGGAVFPSELLEDEAGSLAAQYRSRGLSLEQHLSAQSVPVRGDLHLLRRMFRNALENAFSFASSNVTVSSSSAGQLLNIVIEDDGPGMREEELAEYGRRRTTRVLGNTKEGRLSVGLGSVIIRKVAEIHGGKVRALRKTGSQGTGTRIEIELPASTQAV